MARRRRSLDARLAMAGLEAVRARRELLDAGLLHVGPEAGETAAPVEHPALDDILDGVRRVADPMDALATICGVAARSAEQFHEVLADPGWRDRVLAVGGTSRPLGALLAQHADAVDSLRVVWPVDAHEIAARVREALSTDGSSDDQARAVAVIRRRATADIAARDLTGLATVDQVAAELAALAEGMLRGTLDAVHGHVAGRSPLARMAVIGMGKLGGRELNYVSDVDVMFVHEPVAGADEDAANQEATEVCERLLAVLNQSTTMGRAYEVDPTLRPEGRTGALSRTIASYEAYWERWAATWEFQALIKARPVAGDTDLGRRWAEAAAERVWPESMDVGVVAEVRAMKRRVEGKPEVRRHGARQVKLGPGGLRDIEFAVQLLQIVHGRADANLRRTGTLPAVGALAEGGYIAPDDAETFARCYRLLRNVEHRLQLAHERRTHTIPADEERQEWLARALGYRAAQGPARDVFIRDLAAAQAEVRELHAKLFYRPLLEAHAAVPAGDGHLTGLTDDAASSRLAALGFRDGAAGLRHVRALTHGSTRTARTVRAVLPPMLHALAETPDPDGGLLRLRTLVERVGRGPDLLGVLRDHPPAANLLARVLGTSPFAAELLTKVPQELKLLSQADAGATDGETLLQRARARLRWQDPAAALRRFRRAELLRIVLLDLDDRINDRAVGRALTDLAEACVQAGLDAVVADACAARGLDVEAAPAALAVIGMGKFGGRELHYCSDLDVMLVHAPTGEATSREAAAFAIECANALRALLGGVTSEGSAFEIDFELRPEGRSGPMSRSLESYDAYYNRWADPWEAQALVRARPVAGDPGLGTRFVELIRPLRYPAVLDDEVVRHIRTLKARMESERIPRRMDPSDHLKLGPGGLSDVEWVVQLLQQGHGARHPVVRSPATMEALDGLQEIGALSAEQVRRLRDGYWLMTRVRNRLYLAGFRQVDALPPSADDRARLAHVLHGEPTGRVAFEEEWMRARRRVRAIFERIFYGGPVED